ncbi:MAG: ATP-binding protein [Chloroflexi bacterium]|nr:ATP-binding protein [Chloroflexota bacterium]
MPYHARVVDAELAASLASAGAVLVEGPKACGKTETARRATRSEVLLDVDRRARQAAAIDPSLVLDGDTPRLIDEWQREPAIWDHVRRAVDDRGATGQFILTGSAVPPDEETRHIGAMRIIRLRMRPMALSESGHSTGAVSLAAVLRGEPVRATDPGLTVRQIADLVSAGGWPGNLGLAVPQAQRRLRGYINEIARADVQRVDGVRRDPQVVTRLLRSLARNLATSAPIKLLRADVNGTDGNLKEETVSSYLDALARLMIIEDLPAWSPGLRSRTRLRAASVRHFVDPSLAVAAVRATPARLLADLNWFGFLFENLVVRDLRVYAQALEAEIYHYRDESGLEADAIIEMPDGRWAAFEVKLGPGEVDAAAEHLMKLRARVDTDATGEPLVLAVITGTGYGYVRDDGVAVVPIGALGP